MQAREDTSKKMSQAAGFRPVPRPSRATITGDFKSKFENDDDISEGSDDANPFDDNPFPMKQTPQTVAPVAPK